jgi:PAS domain S-box-containing protein
MSRADRVTKKPKGPDDESILLRRQAEEILKSKRVTDKLEIKCADDQSLIHELQVHQIELEMQNEELVRAREESEKLHEKFVDLYDFAPVGYFTIDQNGTIREVNLTGCRLVGVDRQMITGRRFQTFLHPGSISEFDFFCRNILESDGKQICEVELLRDEQQRFYAHMEGSEIQNGRENSRLIRMTISDITERKKIEDALHKERDFAESIIRTAQVIISILDTNGHIVFINPYMEEISGYTLDEVKGKDWFETFVADQIQEKVRSLFKKAIGDIRTRGEVNPIILKDGRIRFIEWYDTTFQGAGGSIEGLLAIGHDITDKKKAEEALQQANKKLNLLSSITRHDILNEVAILLGYIELAGDDPHDPRMQEYFNNLNNAAKTIQHQIEFTKEYQEIGVKAATWQDISETVEKTGSEFKMENVTLTITCENVEIFADPLLERVFYNLFENAFRYAPPFTTIMVSCIEGGEGLSVVFADDGAGITEQARPHLFERGFGKHTGLGLFLSREILAITGITITENGEHGKGARFEMIVPKGNYRFAGK